MIVNDIGKILELSTRKEYNGYMWLIGMMSAMHGNSVGDISNLNEVYPINFTMVGAARASTVEIINSNIGTLFRDRSILTNSYSSGSQSELSSAFLVKHHMRVPTMVSSLLEKLSDIDSDRMTPMIDHMFSQGLTGHINVDVETAPQLPINYVAQTFNSLSYQDLLFLSNRYPLKRLFTAGLCLGIACMDGVESYKKTIEEIKKYYIKKPDTNKMNVFIDPADYLELYKKAQMIDKMFLNTKNVLNYLSGVQRGVDFTLLLDPFTYIYGDLFSSIGRDVNDEVNWEIFNMGVQCVLGNYDGSIRKVIKWMNL